MTCSHVDSPLLPQLSWMPHRILERKLLSIFGQFKLFKSLPACPLQCCRGYIASAGIYHDSSILLSIYLPCGFFSLSFA